MTSLYTASSSDPIRAILLAHASTRTNVPRGTPKNSRPWSESEDGNTRLGGRELRDVIGVVRRDARRAELHRRRHDERIDRVRRPELGPREQPTGSARRRGAEGHDGRDAQKIEWAPLGRAHMGRDACNSGANESPHWVARYCELICGPRQQSIVLAEYASATFWACIMLFWLCHGALKFGARPRRGIGRSRDRV